MARRNRYPTYLSPARRSGGRWRLPAVAVAVAIAAIVIVAVVHGLGRASAKPEARVPVPAAVMRDLTQIPTATWDAAGAKGAQPPVFVQGTPAAGKPAVLYIGAEFCPFCAAERWALITALGRFGTFQGLTYTHSASGDVFPNTPTFTFYGSTYQSPYIELQAVETTTNIPGPKGYTPLQQPTAAQQALFNRLDGPPYFSGAGSIPFLVVGDRYAWQGASFSPQVLTGTQAEIAAGLAAGQSAAAKAILTNGNEIAAAICASDGGQPTAVCSSAGVAAAGTRLPTAPPK